MPTNIALSSHLESFVHQQINSGRYRNANEVIDAGLSLLESYEEHQKTKSIALQEAINEGLNSGEGVPAEEVFKRLEAKYSAMLEEN